MEEFEKINAGFSETFKAGKLSVGLVVPIIQYDQSAIPDMSDQIETIQLVERLGFRTVWLRDIPFNVPSFGDVGQIYDPFVYLGALSQATNKISLGVASAILPLRHPAHLAKSASSIDQLSNGRLILGVASGDRPSEYPAMSISYDDRSELFRESFKYLRETVSAFPVFKNAYGELNGQLDLVPKPKGSRVPMLITGYSQQSYDWLLENGDGWMNYPKNELHQKDEILKWRADLKRAGKKNKPVMQPLYLDLIQSTSNGFSPMHLGLRCNVDFLIKYFLRIQENGVNHVAINLRFNRLNIRKTLEILAEKILPEFTI